MNMTMLVYFPRLVVLMVMVNLRCRDIVAVHTRNLEMSMAGVQIRAVASSKMKKAELMLNVVVCFSPLPDREVSVGVEIVVVKSHPEILLGWPEL